MKKYFILLLFLPLAIAAQVTKPVHFSFTINTGVTATIAITTEADPNVNGVDLEVGDEIGVFNTSGLCCGAVVWEKVNTAFTVWGDNSMTGPVDGFREGEVIAFRIWVKKSKKEYDAQVQYVAQEPFKSGTYSGNGTYMLASVTGTTPSSSRTDEHVIPSRIKIYQNYPNPFNPSTKINISLPQRSRVIINVLDINGKIVKNLNNSTLDLGEHSFEWNGKDNESKKAASGIYFYKAVIDNKIFTGKMLLSK